jgi:hypothetical protein
MGVGHLCGRDSQPAKRFHPDTLADWDYFEILERDYSGQDGNEREAGLVLRSGLDQKRSTKKNNKK